MSKIVSQISGIIEDLITSSKIIFDEIILLVLVLIGIIITIPAAIIIGLLISGVGIAIGVISPTFEQLFIDLAQLVYIAPGPVLGSFLILMFWADSDEDRMDRNVFPRGIRVPRIIILTLAPPAVYTMIIFFTNPEILYSYSLTSYIINGLLIGSLLYRSVSLSAFYSDITPYTSPPNKLASFKRSLLIRGTQLSYILTGVGFIILISGIQFLIFNATDSPVAEQMISIIQILPFLTGTPVEMLGISLLAGVSSCLIWVIYASVRDIYIILSKLMTGVIIIFQLLITASIKLWGIFEYVVLLRQSD
jgi:hypothetical protein